MSIISSGYRYNVDSIPDSFSKNGKTVSGIKGYCSFIGWILHLFNFAIVLNVNNKSYYLNRKSTIHWLNRHGNALKENVPEATILKLFQKALDEPIKPIRQPDQASPPPTITVDPPTQAPPPPAPIAQAPTQAPPPPAPIAQAPKLETPPLSFSEEFKSSKGFSTSPSGYFLSKKKSTKSDLLKLRKEETSRIDQFVDEQEKTWKKKSFKGMRYKKDEHNLPRTIDVFKEADGKLRIMVLGKKKGGLKLIGSGCDKKAYLAIDWKTKEKYVDLVISTPPSSLNEKLELLQKEMDIATRAALGGKNIAKPPLGLHAYQGKNGETKIGMYMPLYFCSLDKLDFKKSENPLMQKKQIIVDLLRGITSLKFSKIDHRDFKSGNILLDFKENILRADIADFGCSRQETKFRLTKEESKDKYADALYIGNPAHKSPEQVLAKKIYKGLTPQEKAIQKKYDKLTYAEAKQEKKQVLNALETSMQNKIKSLIDKIGTHHNDWAVGLLCLNIMAQGKENTSKDEFDHHAGTMEKMIMDIIFEKKKIDNFDALYNEIQLKVDEYLNKFKATLTDQEIPMFSLVEKLLRVNPAQRLSSEAILMKMMALS